MIILRYEPRHRQDFPNPESPEVLDVNIASVVRPISGRIEVRVPYREGRRHWFKQICGKRTRPDWMGDHWKVARIYYALIVNALVHEYGKVDVYEDHDKTQKCDTRCQNAWGDDCVCSCLGQNHGIGAGAEGDYFFKNKWLLVGETMLIQHITSRAHYVVTPGDFKPISERPDHQQYSYEIRYPSTEGFCLICNPWADRIPGHETKRLVTDHCHRHGWIRGKICSDCNLSLTIGIQSQMIREIAVLMAETDPDGTCQLTTTLWQIAQCPDCFEQAEKLSEKMRKEREQAA